MPDIPFLPFKKDDTVTVSNLSNLPAPIHLRSGSNAVWSRYISAMGALLSDGARPAQIARDALSAIDATDPRPQTCRAPAHVWRTLDDLLCVHGTEHGGEGAANRELLSRFHEVALPSPEGLLSDLQRRTGRARFMFAASLAAALDPEEIREIVHAVQAYDGFTVADDPHGDRAYGSFTHRGERIHFRITIYDRASFAQGLEMAPDDPSVPETALHVITLMSAGDL